MGIYYLLHHVHVFLLYLFFYVHILHILLTTWEKGGYRWQCQVKGKEEGQGEGEWIWREKTWKGLELGKETK